MQDVSRKRSLFCIRDYYLFYEEEIFDLVVIKTIVISDSDKDSKIFKKIIILWLRI
jgi:hypothetical protein